jgi:tRNA(adenine34) deaminase
MDLETAEFWMREALTEARKAGAEGEVPVGAIVLLNGKIIGRGHNNPIKQQDPTAHAEIEALRHAAHNTANYRIPGAVLVVTIEPCVMCVGAMIHARVDELIFGASDPKGGAIQSCFQLGAADSLNHRIRVTSGILQEECGELLKSFFAGKR